MQNHIKSRKHVKSHKIKRSCRQLNSTGLGRNFWHRVPIILRNCQFCKTRSQQYLNYKKPPKSHSPISSHQCSRQTRERVRIPRHWIFGRPVGRLVPKGVPCAGLTTGSAGFSSVPRPAPPQPGYIKWAMVLYGRRDGHPNTPPGTKKSFFPFSALHRISYVLSFFNLLINQRRVF